jgi:hypothetical protein
VPQIGKAKDLSALLCILLCTSVNISSLCYSGWTSDITDIMFPLFVRYNEGLAYMVSKDRVGDVWKLRGTGSRVKKVILPDQQGWYWTRWTEVVLVRGTLVCLHKCLPACLPVGATTLGEPWPPLQSVSAARFLNKIVFFTRWGCQLHAQTPSWRICLHK